uniref:Uncharacterized protein n=1 Tax=Arundo donax TaxID=35708 RepID=A0A0A9ADH4_ARUDO
MKVRALNRNSEPGAKVRSRIVAIDLVEVNPNARAPTWHANCRCLSPTIIYMRPSVGS